jgi:CRISPR-associated protein Csc3
MAGTKIELTWVVSDSDEDNEQPNLLAKYFREVATGPMTSYRRIIQGGNKQGQNYYAHVLDGITILHKLCTAGVIEISDLEEQLLFAAYTIHDINKIPPYGGRDVKLSYVNIATMRNISAELQRIDLKRFFYEWENYLEDIRLLAHLHQHNAAPVFDLDQSSHNFALPYGRLVEFGLLMYAADNLDLSHTLSEHKHKQGFIAVINAVSGRRWRWVTHRLGENRGVLSNIIHNSVVAYLQDRHIHNGQTVIVDLLYYPDGVAYLLPEREQFTWSDTDTADVALLVAKAIAQKQISRLDQFIKPKPIGIKVADAAIDSGATYTEIMYVIRKNIDSKRYPEKQHNERNEKLRANIEKIASNPSTSELANILLSKQESLVPLEQALLKRGELASAYRNLLQDHLVSELKKAHKCDPWTHIYTLLNLPSERFDLYDGISDYQRGYFIACDNADDLDTLFDRFLADVHLLTGEQPPTSIDSKDFYEYLTTNLEISGASESRNFIAHLQQYMKAKHKQCSSCSSSLPSRELMESDVPKNIGVQAFSNRLKGGGREPKRNVCPVCRAQFILEKLARSSFKKNNPQYSSFYLHIYPYAFFTAAYLDAMYSSLKNICHEDNRCFFFTGDYFKQWGVQFEHSLASQSEKQAKQMAIEENSDFGGYLTKVTGISVPNYNDAVGNTPILPLNAIGDNYAQQFIFALTHALMIADFFGCRVVMSRTPVPLLTAEYIAEHALAFFTDGVPLNLRWLMPTNEYRSLETYRERQEQKGGDTEYIKRQDHWSNEQPDEQGYAAYENISKRLSALYQLSQALSLSNEDEERFLFAIAAAIADDPLSAYHIVDLAIEKKIKEVNKNKLKVSKEGSSEYLATRLSKRVGPLLTKIVKE